MIKHVLALASIVLLTACGGGSSSSTPDPGTGTVTPPGDGTRAGTYVGDFGQGTGYYVLNNANEISGVALSSDGTAHTLFGNLGSGSTFSGSLNHYYHTNSNPTSAGIFGPGNPGVNLNGDDATQAFNLNIVDGQTISSLSGPSVNLRGATAGEVTTATASALAGSWSGRHQYCGQDGTNCQVLLTQVTFNGTAITGSTRLVAEDNTETFIVPVTGTLTEFGEAALVQFNWGENTYNGAAILIPGSTQLAFFGETDAAVDRKTIASLLTK